MAKLITSDMLNRFKLKLANIFADKKHSHGVEDLPKYSSHKIGLYKIETNENGSVISVAEVTKDDIVNLGIPSTNTYGDFVKE